LCCASHRRPKNYCSCAANFAILHWFGLRFEPRFTDLDKQLGEIHCAGGPALYEHCLVKPAGQIDLQAIVNEKENMRPHRRDAGPEGDDPGNTSARSSMARETDKPRSGGRQMTVSVVQARACDEDAGAPPTYDMSWDQLD